MALRTPVVLQVKGAELKEHSRLRWDLHLSLSCNPQAGQSQDPQEGPRESPRSLAPRSLPPRSLPPARHPSS